MPWTEALGFITGAVCVVLVVRRNVWNFPVGIANNVVFIVLFLGAGLYADAGLQVVYIGLGVTGWIWWLRGRNDAGELIVRRATWRARVVTVFAVLALTIALRWALTEFTSSTVAVWDALTTALSLVAQWMLNARFLENWLVWIAADVLYVGLYVAKDLWLTAALYAIFVGLCATGLRSWRRAERAAAPSLYAPSTVGC